MTGFNSKREAAAEKLQEPDALTIAYQSGFYDGKKAALAQPAQERQWIWLSDADIAEVIDTTCQYTGSYEEFLIKKAERKSRSMNS